MRAVIDIGTNSVRLLVAKVDAGGIQPVTRLNYVTRLGQAVDAAGDLQTSGIERTLAVLRRLKIQIPRDLKVQVIATSAVRDAANRGQFLAAVKKTTGWDVCVLSGLEEAELSFRGALLSLQGVLSEYPVSVIDIGGGSTEIYTGDASTLFGGGSAQLGAVRLLERHITQHPISPQEEERLKADITALLAPLIEQNLKFGPKTLVGVGGTATTLAALALELEDYDHDLVTGFTLTSEKLLCWYEKLGKLSLEERSLLPTLQKGREDVIITGAAILLKVLEMMGFPHILTSSGDLLYGWLDLVVDEGK